VLLAVFVPIRQIDPDYTSVKLLLMIVSQLAQVQLEQVQLERVQLKQAPLVVQLLHLDLEPVVIKLIFRVVGVVQYLQKQSVTLAI
jgi:hypothetical protein